MLFKPEVILSAASRQQFISKLKELPATCNNRIAKREAAVLVPICVVNDEVCLLYTRRSFNLAVYSGQVAFPGGKIDGNEDAFQTAKRETEEEIGFSSKNIDIWAKLPVVYGQYLSVNITPVVGLLKNYNSDKLKVNSDEVAEVFTVPIKVLCDKNNHGCFMLDNLVIPVYSGGKHKVLGLTAIMTHLFLFYFLPRDVYQQDFTRKTYCVDDLVCPSSYPKF